MHARSSKSFMTWIRIIKFIVAMIPIYGLAAMASGGAFDGPLDLFILPIQSCCHWFMEEKLKVPGSFEDIFVSREEDVGDDAIEGIRYIFVLDISRSIKGSIPKPEWYNEDVDRLRVDGYLKRDAEIIRKRRRQVQIIEAAMVKMFKLMRELGENENNRKDEFAVWTVGNEGTKIFPHLGLQAPYRTEDLAPVGKGIIYDAIQETQNKVEEVKRETRGNLEENTDFVELFKKIEQKYSGGSSSIVITILSDFEHSISGETAATLEEKIEVFFEDIEDFISIDMMMNAIVLQKADSGLETVVIQALKKRVEWYRLREMYIGEDVEKRILFPILPLDQRVYFYYEDGDRVVNHIDFFFENSVDTKITIPDSVQASGDWRSQKDIVLKWLIVDGEETEIESSKLSIGRPFEKRVEHNNTLRLENAMRDLPESAQIQMRVIFDTYWMGYLVEVKFKKLLPGRTAFFMLVLWFFIGVLLLMFVVGSGPREIGV